VKVGMCESEQFSGKVGTPAFTETGKDGVTSKG